MDIKNASESDQLYIAQSGNSIMKAHQAFDSFYKEVDITNKIKTTKEPIELVAFEDDERAGYISGVITHNPADRSESFAVINSIWVETSKRGMGYASLLVEEFESAVIQKQVYRVELFVDIRNEAGVRLWDSEQYQIYQQRRYKILTNR